MKTKACPFCGGRPDSMSVNRLKVITCLSCQNTLGDPMGQTSVADWRRSNDNRGGYITTIEAAAASKRIASLERQIKDGRINLEWNHPHRDNEAFLTDLAAFVAKWSSPPSAGSKERGER